MIVTRLAFALARSVLVFVSESRPTAAREVLVVRRPAPSTERSELRPATLSADSNNFHLCSFGSPGGSHLRLRV